MCTTSHQIPTLRAIGESFGGELAVPEREQLTQLPWGLFRTLPSCSPREFSDRHTFSESACSRASAFQTRTWGEQRLSQQSHSLRVECQVQGSIYRPSLWPSGRPARPSEVAAVERGGHGSPGSGRPVRTRAQSPAQPCFALPSEDRNRPLFSSWTWRGRGEEGELTPHPDIHPLEPTRRPV